MIKEVLVAAALLSPLATGDCGNATVHAKVCVEKQLSTVHGAKVYVRLNDSLCESGQAGARWRYYTDGIEIPRVGQGAPSKTGSWTEPSGTLVRIPATGGKGSEQR